MTTTYITDDGENYEATDARDLVTAMRSSSWTQCDTLEAWMRDTASRVTEVSGASVRYDTPDNFVADLINAGVLKEKKDD